MLFNVFHLDESFWELLPLGNKCFSSTLATLNNPLVTPKCLSSRDGRMLFDYLADKHGVSSSADSSTTLRSSHDSSMNPVLFWGANGRGNLELQHIKWLPKTLSHFRGFYGLKKFLWTFTFCASRMLGILYLTWLHAQPSILKLTWGLSSVHLHCTCCAVFTTLSSP